ncbi:MAG: DNA-processing protein DprA [Nocardioides sp.]
MALSVVCEPGDDRMLALADALGPERLLTQLRGEPGLAARFRGLEPARVLDDATALGLRFVTPADAEWPVQIGDLARAPSLQARGGVPVGLWVRGPLRLDQLASSVAVVGSRSATTYGADLAADLAAEVARSGRPVVSGGAYGIDQAAHRGALVGGGPTVAVLACGADRIYPVGHRQLIEHIADTGAVVAETPPGGAPMKIRFLARNRLIATLATGTVVVEAAARSGALNTANWAGRLNRAVMGVPGPVTSAPSEGVHHLIRSGAATLVTSGEEVLEEIAPAGAHLAPEPRGPEHPRDRLEHHQLRVLDAVPLVTGAGVGSIARTAGLAELEVRGTLLDLEGLGMVQEGRDGWRLAAPGRE